jgi:hypothetical protein
MTRKRKPPIRAIRRHFFHSLLEEALLHHGGRSLGQLRAIGQAELVFQVFPMGADGFLADLEGVGDLRARLSAADQPQYLELPIRERAERHRLRFSGANSAQPCFHQFIRERRADGAAAARDHSDRLQQLVQPPIL